MVETIKSQVHIDRNDYPKTRNVQQYLQMLKNLQALERKTQRTTLQVRS